MLLNYMFDYIVCHRLKLKYIYFLVKQTKPNFYHMQNPVITVVSMEEKNRLKVTTDSCFDIFFSFEIPERRNRIPSSFFGVLNNFIFTLLCLMFLYL